MDKEKVLLRYFPGAQWALRGDQLEWLDDSPAPTEAELTALWSDLQAEMAAEVQARQDAKASAVAKLEALGLTVEEVSVAFGIEV